MSHASSSGSGPIPDRGTPEVITATYQDIRAIEGHLYVFNVIENLLRRLDDRVLCLTIVRRQRTDSDPTCTLLVDIVSALPGLSPGPDHRYVVLGEARVGAEWREATAFGEPSLPMSPANRQIMGLEDLTEKPSVPLVGWGMTEEDGRDDDDETDENVDVERDDVKDKRDDQKSSDCEDDEDRWYQDRFLLTFHPRGQETIVFSKCPRPRLPGNNPIRQARPLTHCLLCETDIPTDRMNEPCIFHPGLPTQPSGGDDPIEQLLTPPLDGNFVSNTSRRAAVTDHAETDFDDDETVPGELDDGDASSTLLDQAFCQCCGSAVGTCGCMVERRHMSTTADRQTWRRTWDIYRASQETGDA